MDLVVLELQASIEMVRLEIKYSFTEYAMQEGWRLPREFSLSEKFQLLTRALADPAFRKEDRVRWVLSGAAYGSVRRHLGHYGMADMFQVAVALEALRDTAKPDKFWEKVLAGEEVAALKVARAKPKSQVHLDLERMALVNLGPMDTLDVFEAREKTAAVGKSKGVSNPIMVAFATSDRYFVGDDWLRQSPEGRVQWIDFRMPDMADSYLRASWKAVSWELCEDRWTSPDLFVVDGDQSSYPVIRSVGYSGP